VRHDTQAQSPLQEMEQSEEMQRFREALQALSPKFRDVITLCGLQGKSYEEAAEILAVPIGTVRSRLNKARLLLKGLFMEDSIREGQ
jgi:RNA polymerase sigma factor (sigma-70 family)